MYKLIIGTIILTAVFSNPTAVFHGMGDFCAQPGMKSFTEKLGELTAEYSTCIEIGNGSGSSISMDFAEQALEACEKVKQILSSKEKLSMLLVWLQYKSIKFSGLSQGALLARHIVQDCDFGGKVEKLLSIGGPQMGVSAFPKCESGPICYPINHLTKSLVYSDYIQSNVGPAGYFRDAKRLQTYLEKSHFLPDVNNERNFSQLRKDRFTSLKGVMLVKFTKDMMMHPKETSWFQSWDNDGDVVELEETEFYKSDLIGLKTLNESKKVKFVEIEGDHLKFSQEDIESQFIPFLKE